MKNKQLLIHLAALLSGLIFGLGLLLAGMANPAKVLAFLDITGAWDPSLALVMIGAIVVSIVAFAWASKHKLSLLKQTIHLPDTQLIDKNLMLGASLFGVGWGLVGICPGPALVLLGAGNQQGIIFLIAMMVGMGLFEGLKQVQRS